MTTDAQFIDRAVQLAERGEGRVEPNPPVGCVVVRGGRVVGEGWHDRFGGPHAEVVALEAAGAAARGADLFVTLEPCCHHGKTPPCSAAIAAAGVRRVRFAQRDPFPQVDGGGLQQLRDAGIDVAELPAAAADRLNAPYLKRVREGRPWVIAKWAMTIDGQLATASGDSRWISNETSRAAAHRLRGRMDAILVGRGTAEFDDPLLTARPPGPRTATRIVLSSQADLAIDSQLLRTARDIPLLVAVGPRADQAACERLRDAGCEVFASAASTYRDRLAALLDELGGRQMTNVLIEGGPRLLGTALAAQLVDEVHVFIAPKLVGEGRAIGSPAGPDAGPGIQLMRQAAVLDQVTVEQLEGDVYLRGRLPRPVDTHPPAAAADGD